MHLGMGKWSREEQNIRNLFKEMLADGHVLWKQICIYILPFYS